MKILYINSVIGFGSTGRIVYDQYKTAEAKGDTPYVIYGRKSGMDDVHATNIGSKLSFMTHYVMSRVFDRHGFGSKSATKKLIKFMDDFNPDVIHLHNIHGYYMNIKILFNYIKAHNIKTVWSLHDCWAFTGHCSHFDQIGCMKWQTHCYDCEERVGYPKRLIFDQSKRNFHEKKALFTGVKNMTIITPSDWLNRSVKQSFLSEYEVFTINNGIDLTLFKPTPSDFKDKLNIADKKIVLGIASSFTHKKGFDDFISLSKILSDEFIIILVGLNEKQIKSLPPNIIGFERLSDKSDIIKLYSAASVFVNPTKEDTFPTTLIESLACATPVISYDVGGCGEIFEQSCGVLVKKDSINDIKSAIIEIMKKVNIEEACMNKAQLFDKNNQAETTYNRY